MTDVAEGIRRITFPLPLGIDHVHCYLLRARDGGWILVDTGLGIPDAEARWTPILAELDGPIERIVITHGHPDHVGDAAPVAELTGAAVLEGRLDHQRSLEVWRRDSWHDETAAFLRDHGMPADDVELSAAQTRAVAQLVHLPQNPEPLEPGDRVEGWEVVHLPGHADGHLSLLRDGTLIAGDAILAEITPTVGVYPGGTPDPLGQYLDSLEQVVALAPDLALAGHGPPIEEPVARAREIIEHHRERADATAAALADGPSTAYAVSLAVFRDALPPMLRRFAVAESLAHLHRLVVEGRAVHDGLEYALR